MSARPTIVREVETAVEGLEFPESPRWHRSWLVFTDLKTQRVSAYRPTSGDLEVIVGGLNGQTPSGLGWLPDGRLLVVSMEGQLVLRLEHDGRLETHADLRGLAAYDVNDMVVTASGRAFVGQIGYDYKSGQSPQPSPLLYVDPDGSSGVAAIDLECANGMALTSDGGKLVVAETFSGRLTAFDVGADGVLGARRLFAQLESYLDGMCLDAEGAAWVAHPWAHRFVRVLDGGAITHLVELPDQRAAIACVLGDDDGLTLYMCTSGSLDSTAALADLAGETGRIERIRVDVPGTHRS